jgi:hypothetical protein
MTSLTMMYVHFDKNGEIKAISPSIDDGLGLDLSNATFLLSEVEEFLLGRLNPSDYKIQELKRLDAVKYKIVRKATEVKRRQVRTLDTFLTKVADTVSEIDDDQLIITNNISGKVISIRLAKSVKEMYTNGTNEEAELVDEFLNRGDSTIYITQKNNPHYLLFSFNFSPTDLFEKQILYFEYENDCSNSSAYTKKIIAKYRYREKE